MEKISHPSEAVAETIVSAPVPPPVPVKKNNVCHHDGCSDRIVKIIGDCRYCERKHCGRHRLPEMHACPNLQACREAHFKKNENKLLGEKTVAGKV